MKTVVVTGALGFIGRHALPHLVAAGYDVHGVDLKSEAIPGVVMHSVNLLQPEEVQALFKAVRPSYLLHLAWYVEPGKFWTSAQNLHWVQASIEILSQFSAHGGRRCVSAGTCAEYSWLGNQPCREGHTPLEPVTLYGACKHALQVLQQRWSTQEGFSAAWGRIFHLYGPYEPRSRFVPQIIGALLTGEPARCSHGRQLRDFMHVDDVARAFVKVLESDFQGPINVASGEAIRIADVAEMLASQIGRPDLLRLGAISAPEGEPAILVAETARLRALGFSSEHSLEAGLENSIAWWRASLTSAGGLRL